MAATDYDFNLTRTEIIERAFRIIGALTLGESLNGNQSEQGRIALNSLVKSWQTKHLFLWTLSEQSSTILAGTASISVGSDPGIIGIDSAWYTVNNQDIPIEVISFRKYQKITDKTSSTLDSPSCVALDYNKSTPTMYIWPQAGSTAAITVYWMAILRLQDMDTTTGNADIPQRFLEALAYGLATQLADEYGLPLNERKYLRGRYDEAFAYAKQSDREREDYEFVQSAFSVSRRQR